MTLTEKRTADDGKLELIVLVAPDEFEKAVETAYRKQKNKINIQGFRKGKAPRAIIERMYGEGFFYDEALNDILPRVYDEAISEADVETIDRPEVDVVELDKAQGVKLSFKVTLRPELTVGKYKGIEATKHVHTVEESDLERELAALREKASRLVSVEDRPARKDDISVIDFEGFVDGVAFEGGKGDKYSLTLGSGQFIPGFEEQIIGKAVGDEFDVNVKFPDDYGAENLAGKDATFKVKLNELRIKEYPEMDDEFAKDVSESDTLEELRASIKERLEKERDEQASIALENQIADAVAATLEGEVPEVMVESRVDDLVRDFGYRLSQQGLDMDTYRKYTGQDEESFRKGFAEQAAKQVRVRLALEAVVRAENLSVSDEELEDEYKKMAEQYETELEKVKNIFDQKEMRRDMAVTKALEFIKDNAAVTVEQHTAADHEHEHESAEKAEDAAPEAEKAE